MEAVPGLFRQRALARGFHRPLECPDQRTWLTTPDLDHEFPQARIGSRGTELCGWLDLCDCPHQPTNNVRALLCAQFTKIAVELASIDDDISVEQAAC